MAHLACMQQIAYNVPMCATTAINRRQPALGMPAHGSIRAGPSFPQRTHNAYRVHAGELLDHVALNGPLLEAEALPVMKQVARPTCSIAAALPHGRAHVRRP